MIRIERLAFVFTLLVASPVLASFNEPLCDKNEAGCRFFAGILLLLMSTVHPLFIAVHVALVGVWGALIRGLAFTTSNIGRLIVAGVATHVAGIAAALTTTLLKADHPFWLALAGYATAAAIIVVSARRPPDVRVDRGRGQRDPDAPRR